MGHKGIGYHTRELGNDSKKLSGGSFGGSLDMETINRLTRFFTVEIQASGTPVFVNEHGKKVNLYVSVDPGTTEKGKVALAADRKRREALQALEDAKEREVNDLLESLSYDEILARLRG